MDKPKVWWKKMPEPCTVFQLEWDFYTTYDSGHMVAFHGKRWISQAPNNTGNMPEDNHANSQ